MKKRVDGLNFIRILGMSMILLFHAKLTYGFAVGNAWLDDMISIGAIFVTVFFMLSGFGLRKSNRQLTVSDRSAMIMYYRKRILSIYPLFLLLTIVALTFQFRVMDSWSETLIRLPIQFSMLHVLLGKEMHGFLFNDNCWYISALFVLYLLFPFLNEKINHWSTRLKLRMCIVLWLLSAGIYFYCVYATNLTFLDYYPNPFLRIPEFVIGMLCADFSEEHTSMCQKMTFHPAPVLCITVVISTIGLTLLRPHFVFETNLYGILTIPCTALTFLTISRWDRLNQLGAHPVVRRLSSLGLEMYLCQSFATLTLTHVKVAGQWDELAFIGLSIVFAVVVHEGFTTRISHSR